MPVRTMTEGVRARILRLAERITSPKRIAEQVGVSRRNVSRVLAGFAPAPLVDDPLLMPGERRVAARRCAEGHLVEVWPCRECRCLARRGEGPREGAE